VKHCRDEDVAMPPAAKLKVFRMPVGFHDAYVAAPSQKAAIEAWGSDRDVFSRGEAELVTDPALTAEPLAAPGTVIKRLRGTAAEHIAALPPEKEARRAKQPAGKPASPAGKPKRKPAPRPSRAGLEAAEQALAEAEARRAADRKALAEREAALARERRSMEKAQAAETARLARARDKAAAAYEKAIRRWRG
jgi:type IV secretory pathway VirB10-like protein